MSKQFYNPKALESARDSGYRSTAHAIAEILDNSFDAEATVAKVVFIEKPDQNNNRSVSDIFICDNGYGMSEENLEVCLQFGGGVNDDPGLRVSKRKRGKYGYGLPNASLSQCPHISVYSWEKGGKVRRSILDLAEQISTNSIEIPDVEEVKLPPVFEVTKANCGKTSGTIVHWANCDRLSHKRARTIMDHSEKFIGRLFRHIISKGAKIYFSSWEYQQGSGKYTEQICDKQVRCNDPLFLMKDCVVDDIVKKLAASATHDKVKQAMSQLVDGENVLPTNDRVEDLCQTLTFKWKDKDYEFEIIASKAKKNVQKPGIREGGKTDLGSFYGLKESFGSISFVRSDREISSGRYGLYRATLETNRWWSIEVRFTPDADELLGVPNNKQDIGYSATLRGDLLEEGDYNPYESSLLEARTELWVELTKSLTNTHKALQKLVKEDAKLSDLDPVVGDIKPGPPSSTDKTTAASIKTDGKRISKFSKEEKKQILDILKERYPHIKESELENAIDRFDKAMVRGIMLYSPSDGDWLWSLTSITGFLVILVNTNHEFYENIMSPLRIKGFESALAGIELFISSLAWDEYEHFWSVDSRRNVLEEFRSYVGLHLKRYLRENHVSISDGEFTVGGNENEEIDE